MRAMPMPKREIVFLFGLIILFPLVQSQNFDSFWFVQQWPINVCKLQTGRCVGQSLRSFTIHGVWPQNGGNSVVNCPGNSFDFNQIAHLENNLNVVWPNIITGNNKFFWGHEWNKHGICSENMFNEAAYFQMAINMRTSIDLLGALRVGGLAPNNRSKSRQRVRTAIKNQYNKEPILRCKSKSGSSYLTEIVMCFDDDGTTLINCNFGRSNCGNSFIF